MKFLFSTKISLGLLLTLAISMGVATFIENDNGTLVARELVYEAWWFELMMAWLALNFIFHIGKYRLLSKEKLAVGLFHIAFIIIVIGAGVTRFFSREGVMHIREGQSQNTFYSAENYLQLADDSDQLILSNQEFIPKIFEVKSYPMTLDGIKFELKAEEYIKGARQEFAAGEETLLEISVLDKGNRQDFTLKKGQNLQVGELLLSTAANPKAQIQLIPGQPDWQLLSKLPLQLMEMSTQQMGTMEADSLGTLKLRTLYQWETGALVIRSIRENVRQILVPEPNEKIAKDYLDGVKISVLGPDQKVLKTGYFLKVNRNPDWVNFTYGEKSFRFTYGPKAQQLPFSIYLNDFQLERYPGSSSPSSYASEVMVQDKGEEWPFRIYMNNVLDHKGYRFYQSSYDSDEGGTVLSINQDRPGTYITYFGYSLLTIAMFWALFIKGSRFSLILLKLGKLNKVGILIGIFAFASLPVAAQDSTGGVWVVPEEKAAAYGRLIVQDLDGRMKPLNTLSHEIVRKIYGKSRIELVLPTGKTQLNPEQFLLAAQLDPEGWSKLPLIKIDQKKSAEIFQYLGKPSSSHLSFLDFVTEDGDYKLSNQVEEANKLKPSQRTEGHNELLKVDERFNIFYGLLTGDFLKLYPNRLDGNNTWFTSQQFTQGFEEEDAIFVKNIGGMYLNSLKSALSTGDWSEADEALGYIDLYQRKAGSEVYPDQILIDTELLYTQINLGNRLFGVFWLLGVIMLFTGILFLFYQGKALQIIWKSGTVLAWIGWLVFTIHLGMRWFIAKHPPWSDGFEMLVFVAWGVLLSGLAFSGKSKLTVPLSLLFSGTLLFVSFLDWLNPEITNLMPVLNSYWLKIHVAIIVSGYAPLGLSAIIGLLSLFLLIFKPANPTSNWWKAQKELIAVNELSITIGLYLLTVGTFLGGVWANESWGRYWAWDPKETWALISILVYAIILHLRLIPGTRSAITFSLSSLWGFSSIIMTSFGVNYYLSGLHSYAKGDPVPVPQWVFVLTGILLVISVIAVFRYRKLTFQEKQDLMI
ncbi:cytochrome c-type biogenesis protein CcsB [Algoriphagus alkaliphilus]|uniref:Cytochrome c-type biogenesis protein CcsB n=1 Tax=Algoriphagus alkaliphilus TaxID=279824 RepID=A0A1G5WCD3_9BACT|nr:cytochrome c biogenesis protein CcsA [Algoriphagus alkaliphilus]MBA4302531.1 cytochrome C biogenesis protein [Cyclobacterium sp.]SDA55652.1 cytochrome c-type biogenesis protein CcsB [Algoriphagus alkaliphilus]